MTFFQKIEANRRKARLGRGPPSGPKTICGRMGTNLLAVSIPAHNWSLPTNRTISRAP
jgi:hypothetical protein